MSKKLSMHVDVDAFLPANDDEKQHRYDKRKIIAVLCVILKLGESVFRAAHNERNQFHGNQHCMADNCAESPFGFVEGGHIKSPILF